MPKNTPKCVKDSKSKKTDKIHKEVKKQEIKEKIKKEETEIPPFIDDNSFIDFLQPASESIAPVLEKIAGITEQASDLEDVLSQTPKPESSEKENLEYSAFKLYDSDEQNYRGNKGEYEPSMTNESQIDARVIETANPAGLREAHLTNIFAQKKKYYEFNI